MGSSIAKFLRIWIDAEEAVNAPRSWAAQFLRLVPFILVHAGCLGVIWVGFSWPALAVALGLYMLRMFAITGFYHRYFSHRTFKTSRAAQFIFAFLGNTAGQRGPLWWAAHHREHHRHSDEEPDLHSPRQKGFWRSHMLWFLEPDASRTKLSVVPDLAKYPELRLLDRYDGLAPLALACLMFILGAALEIWWPALGTDGWQMLVWGFFISTTACYHATYTINSLAHVWGRQRFRTRDDSRNNIWLALLTFGEGWHNNHHFFPGAARQGFYWWEIDLTYYVLWVLARLGIIWDLNPVPARVYERARADSPSP